MSMTVRALVAYGTSRQMVTEDLELERCLGCSERCTRRAVTPASSCAFLYLCRQMSTQFYGVDFNVFTTLYLC